MGKIGEYIYRGLTFKLEGNQISIRDGRELLKVIDVKPDFSSKDLEKWVNDRFKKK